MICNVKRIDDIIAKNNYLLQNKIENTNQFKL